MPGTAYARRVPSLEFANTALKRDLMSNSSMTAYEDEGRGSESELVAVVSKFNTKAVLAGKPDMIDINRHTTLVKALKPLPAVPDRANSYG
jgi:hypothetical protein